MKTITIQTELTVMTCPNCAGSYALSQAFLDEARSKGGFKQCWCCPYCKGSRGYGQSKHDLEKAELQKQLDQSQKEKQWLTERRDYAQKESDHFRRSRDGLKSQLTKVKKRIGHGTCPCCNRSFEDLRRHMESKHPEFKEPLQEPAPLPPPPAQA
jgi:hypothetical protein